MTGIGQPGEQVSRFKLENLINMASKGPSFEAYWQEARPGLERALKGRGAAPDVVDDVVQETSIRLLTVWERLDHERPVGPFARSIAFNCLIDVYRGRRLISLDDLPDEASTYDVEEHALARARLTSAMAAMDSLTANDRKALLAEIGVGARASTSAAKMARLRARKRLVAMMDRVASAFGTAQLSWRRIGIWMQELRPTGEASLAVMAGVATLATAAVLGIAPNPETLQSRTVNRLDGVRATSMARNEPSETKRRRGKGERAARLGKMRREHSIQQAKAQAQSEETPTEDTTVDAGNARARASEGRGYKRIEACTGHGTSDKKDDHSASVTVDLGEGDDPGESCQ